MDELIIKNKRKILKRMRKKHKEELDSLLFYSVTLIAITLLIGIFVLNIYEMLLWTFMICTVVLTYGNIIESIYKVKKSELHNNGWNNSKREFEGWFSSIVLISIFCMSIFFLLYYYQGLWDHDTLYSLFFSILFFILGMIVNPYGIPAQRQYRLFLVNGYGKTLDSLEEVLEKNGLEYHKVFYVKEQFIDFFRFDYRYDLPDGISLKLNFPVKETVDLDDKIRCKVFIDPVRPVEKSLIIKYRKLIEDLLKDWMNPSSFRIYLD